MAAAWVTACSSDRQPYPWQVSVRASANQTRQSAPQDDLMPPWRSGLLGPGSGRSCSLGTPAAPRSRPEPGAAAVGVVAPRRRRAGRFPRSPRPSPVPSAEDGTSRNTPGPRRAGRPASDLRGRCQPPPVRGAQVVGAADQPLDPAGLLRADVGRSRPPPPGPRHKPRAPAGPPVRRRIRPAVRARRRAGSPAWHTGWPRGGVGGEHRPMEEIGDDVATSNPSPSPLPSSPSPSPPLRAQTGSAPAPPPGWAWPEPDHRPSPTSGATPRSPPPTPPGSIDTCSTRPTPKGGLGGAGSGVPPSVAPEHKARRGPTRQ
jgi:hypothetical protein